MRCPSCQAECPEQAEACFTCGKALFALSQGTLLAGRYEIVRPVGRGGMSRVYQAYDRVLGEAVAIKVLRAELAWEPEMRQRFLHEIRLARRVSHPNVCRIHEYGEDGPRRYISMELLEGVNLREVLRNRGLSTEEAFEVVLQMADGLAAVHQHGIVHRDFKASNIMVVRTGVAKLMDFGIAKQAETDTSNFTTPGQVLGTPEYMSPEHARGAKVDFRSDIYALGCVVFEIFTGQAPFRGANAFATISKHFYEAPPLDGPLGALIPEALVPVLRKALAKDPDRRYGSVPEAREALRLAQAASVQQPLEVMTDPNAAGSARLRELCEALLAKGVPADSEPDSASSEVTPSLANVAPPRPVPVVEKTASSRRRRVPVAQAIAAGALVLTASSMLLWSASRDTGGAALAQAPPRMEPVRVAASPFAAAVPSAPPAIGAVTPSPAAVRTAPLPDRPRPEPRPTASASSVASPAPFFTTPATTPLAPRPAPTSQARAERAGVAAAPTGTLRLLIVPWAEVMVDGTSVGTVQLRDLTLAPGAHTVRVVHPDYQPLQRKVTVEAGGTVRLVLDLSDKGIRRIP